MVGAQQGLGHGVGGGEVAAVAGLDGADGEGEVGLAAAGLSEQQDGPLLVDEAQGSRPHRWWMLSTPGQKTPDTNANFN